MNTSSSPVVMEVLGQAGRLLAAGQRGGQPRGLGAYALVERLVVAEAGQPGDAQAGGGELAQRTLQQARVVRETELAPEEVGPLGARSVRPPEDVTRPIRRLHSLIVRTTGIRGHQPAVEQGEERLQLVPLRVVDRVARRDRQLHRQSGRRTVYRAERADGGIDGVYRERLLRALHGNEAGVPAVREVGVEELEPGRRLDVSELQIGDVNQAEQRAARAVRGLRPGKPGAEVVADEMRLARADLDGAVRS